MDRIIEIEEILSRVHNGSLAMSPKKEEDLESELLHLVNKENREQYFVEAYFDDKLWRGQL